MAADWNMGSITVIGTTTVSISGTANVNVTNASIAVTGTVSITGTPSVSISGTPAVTISSGSVNIGAGDVNIYPKNQFLEAGTFSYTTDGTVAGALNSIYDIDITTYFQMRGYSIGYGSNSLIFLKWDMGSVVSYKNIYLYYGINTTSGATAVFVKIQGSDNGTDWTDIASNTHGYVETITQFNLVATTTSYRYIRVANYGTVAADKTTNLLIYGIKGVI